MKKFNRAIGSLASAFFILGCAAALSSESPNRQTMDFDHGWRFLKVDAPGADSPEFDDAAWRKLDVPHDWSIEGPFSETNRTGGAGGFLPAGVGWYRKQFTLPSEKAGRRVFIEFDGVMANSDVWLNGQHLGKRPCGYVSFGYELTPHLRIDGGPNVLAVRADNADQPASRWYAGAGIYRHVRLVVTDPVHVEHWSTYVTTPQVAASQATVRVQSAVVNQSDSPREVTLEIAILDPKGRTVQTTETSPQTIPAGNSAGFSGDLVVKKPLRWDLDRPVLYQAVTRVRVGKTPRDEDTTPFGIREFKFDADTGFWLNGKNFKLKGVCLHADGSAFGAAVPLAVWKRRLTELKKLGVNAIRTAHNPPVPEFLDLCDRMGMLVMDEFFDCWTVRKNPYDYHLYFNEWSKIDARDTIRRDRNHPGIVLYSVGNEIHDTPRAELAKGILKGLVEVCHENDPTRPVTQALFRPNVSGDYTNGLADLLDVIGTNYRDNELLEAHRAKPARRIIGTEQQHNRLTWLACRDHPEHAGQFLWTGIDYLGESRRWPIVAAGSGLLDRTGTPRPLGGERQSWWSDKPMVFITRRTAAGQNAPTDPGFDPLDRRQVLFSDWTPHNLKPHEENVEVYSNCEEVELRLNGKSLGSQPRPADGSPRNWQVPFEPGTLKAEGKNRGRVVATFALRTAGKPARIVLAADRDRISPVWDDVSYVSATVVDENGVMIPSAGDSITFKLTAPGEIAAVDSADNACHDPFQASERRAFQGRCVVFVRATAAKGKMTLTASAPGLKASSTTFAAVASPADK